jgi:hypothetical protein
MPEQEIAPYVPERLARLRRTRTALITERDRLGERTEENTRALKEIEDEIADVESKL